MDQHLLGKTFSLYCQNLNVYRLSFIFSCKILKDLGQQKIFWFRVQGPGEQSWAYLMCNDVLAKQSYSYASNKDDCFH